MDENNVPVTVNEYLIKCDKQSMGEFYLNLGLSLGLIQQKLDPSGELGQTDIGNTDVIIGNFAVTIENVEITIIKSKNQGEKDESPKLPTRWRKIFIVLGVGIWIVCKIFKG